MQVIVPPLMKYLASPWDYASNHFFLYKIVKFRCYLQIQVLIEPWEELIIENFQDAVATLDFSIDKIDIVQKEAMLNRHHFYSSWIKGCKCIALLLVCAQKALLFSNQIFANRINFNFIDLNILPCCPCAILQCFLYCYKLYVRHLDLKSLYNYDTNSYKV